MERGGEMMESERPCMRNVSGGAVEKAGKESQHMIVQK
jgi:hypothetical protein